MGGQESALQVYGHADDARQGKLLAFPRSRTVLEPNRLGLQSGDFVERIRADQKEGRIFAPEIWDYPSAVCVDAEGTKWEVCVMRATSQKARVECRPLSQDPPCPGSPVLSLQQVLDWAMEGRACRVTAEGSGVFTVQL